MLNHIEIKSNNIIQNSEPDNFRNASYDLRVDVLITIDGKLEKTFKIQPNSMAIAVSRERIKLPNNIIGHAYIKTRLSQKGIMANNIGIIDTEYEGQISSVLVNFGKTDYEIKEGDAFLRVTFTKIPHITSKNSIPNNFGSFTNGEYKNERRSDAMSFLGNSFINIDRVVVAAKREINNSLVKIAKITGIWVAAASFIIAAFSLYTNVKDKTNNKIENIQNQINSFNDTQLILMKLQKEQESKVVLLRRQLDSIQIENNKLRLDRDLKITKVK